MKDPNGPILAIRISALGDVAMTLPAIYSLAQAHPDRKICVLVNKRFEKLFLERPANLELIGFSKEEYGGIGGLWRLCRLLQQKQFSCAADLHNVLRSWLVSAWLHLHGTRVAMVPKRRRERHAIFKGRLEAEPFTERYFKVFQRLGLDIQPTFIGFFKHNTESEKHAHASRLRIGIAPFARYSNKTYPTELMQQVISQLHQTGRFDICLFGGGKREISVFEQWKNLYSSIIYISGEKTLADELALMHSLHAMLSMDSANQHLAALAGVRVVSLWGSTTPACGFLAWQQSRNDALVANLPCQPCSIGGSPTCPRGDLACFHAIKPETIVERLCQAAEEVAKANP